MRKKPAIVVCCVNVVIIVTLVWKVPIKSLVIFITNKTEAVWANYFNGTFAISINTRIHTLNTYMKYKS